MDVNVPANPEDAVKLLHQINMLRADVMLFIGIITSLVGAYLILTKLIATRRERATEEAKNKRAESFRQVSEKQSEALNRLAQALADHTAHDKESSKLMTTTMENMNSVVVEIRQVTVQLRDKSDGRINRNDSIRMIRDRFVQNVYREFCSVIEVSLRENDFEHRKEHVRRKVKTVLGRIMVEARRYLCSYNLAFEPTMFFKTYPDEQIERFVLCDMVWESCESLFKKPHEKGEALKEVVEESQLLIENVVKDYVTACGNNIDVSINFREDSHFPPSAVLRDRTTRLLSKTGPNPILSREAAASES